MQSLMATSLLVTAVVVAAPLASAATPLAGPHSQSALITVSPSTTSGPSGAPQTYNIALSCQGTGGSECGPHATISIPLDPSVVPSMTAGGWTYTATSATASLIASGPTIVGNHLVITLNDAEFVGGYSGSVRLTMTPPNNITPNNTSWTVNPTISGDNIAPVPVPTPSTSTATAKPLVSVTKVTADGGSVYEINKDVTFTITAKCSAASTGNLFLDTAAVVDALPSDLAYVSSTPPGTYDAGTHHVTWNYSRADTAAFPKGCNADGTGTTTFQVVARTPATPPANQPITNQVSFQGTGPDATNPAGITSSSAASVPVQIVAFPNPNPGPGYASISKSSLAPIPQAGITSGNQYVATYPGNWVPLSSSPSYSVGAAAASFQTTVSYGLVGRYETTLYDPVPCLTNLSGGNKYSSNGYDGPYCQQVAFHTQVFTVYSPGYDATVNGLGQAYAAGWRPQAILTNGSRITLNATGGVATTATSATFSIPVGDDVATIILPPSTSLMTKTLQLTMYGFADGGLASLNGSVNELHNEATAIPKLDGNNLSPVSYGASVFTVPTIPQLGISKSFGALGAGPSGTTILNMVGSINIPDSPLTRDVVLTDLLPIGLTWANPTTSATFTLTQGKLAPTRVTATIQLVSNYQSSGRQLIRITVPAADFTSTGSWTITPPANLLEVVTPTALGVYANTDQIFLYGLGTNPLNPVCSTPTQTSGGISPATYQSDNSLDLAGDGNLIEPYCQNSASLVVQGTGAAFALTKTVQGDLDNVARGPLGIGNASPAGFGLYKLTWSNVGSDRLNNTVIYDVLPYVGDTGVSAGQSAVARGSQFAPIFDATTVPPDVTVQYSESTNPCRPEVYPTDPSCVNDWSSTPPSPLSLVKALRYASSATYSSSQGFTVGIKVSVPAGVVNQVAWNSAATNASDVTDPSATPLPAEPPKVGLVAPSTPTMTSSTSDPVTTAYSSLSDQVTISGTGGAPGTLNWVLFGPIDPNNLSCEGLHWAGAPIAASGSVPITGDGPVTTGPATLGKGGCYSWGDQLIGTSYPYGAVLPPGSANEQTIATPFPPSITTTATKAIAVDGTQSVTDSITIDGIPVAAPNPSPLTWTLYGPIAPASGGSCDGLDWTGAPVLDSGSIVITGNSTYETPSVTLSAPGCYSFGQDLPSTADSIEVTQAPGLPAESVHAIAPTISTTTSSAMAKPYQSLTDTVDVTGTNGGAGTLAWSLVGPVPASLGDCASVSFTGAPTVASGTLDVLGDGPANAGPATVKGPGCYSWVETLSSNGPGGFPGPVTSAAGTAHEVIDVTPWVPTIETTASTSSVTASGESVHDTVTISGSGLSVGIGGATSGVLQWTLEGPVSPVAGSCAQVSWAAAPISAQGSIAVTKDGTYDTPTTQIVTVGCYSYQQVLQGDADRTVVTSPLGISAETIGFTTSGGGSSHGGLAFTGFSPWAVLRDGAFMLVVGLSLLIGARRRRTRA